MKKIKTHTFNKTNYTIQHQARIKGDDLGECDFNTHTIRIPFDGDTLDELDTVIHECLHACLPYLVEDQINATATDVARMLWRLKWRKDPDLT
jgi:hypothetical protein